MVPLHFVGEPEAVVSGHHHVDDREIVMVQAERRERLVGIRRSLRTQTKAGDPPGHEVADRRFIVHDEYGSERSHRYRCQWQDDCHAEPPPAQRSVQLNSADVCYKRP